MYVFHSENDLKTMSEKDTVIVLKFWYFKKLLAAAIGQDLDCYDPVLHILDGHKGAVTGVQWIPNSKDLFLTCGTDSELRVYSSSEVSKVHRFNYIFLGVHQKISEIVV